MIPLLIFGIAVLTGWALTTTYSRWRHHRQRRRETAAAIAEVEAILRWEAEL